MNYADIFTSMNYTHETTHPPTTTSNQQVHDVLRARAGARLSASQIVAALPEGSLNLKQVQNALGSLIRSETYPHVHRLDRGEYVYDEQRQRRRIAKRKAAKSSSTQPVVEAKRKNDSSVIPIGALRPVKDAAVMQDTEGNLYVVRATKV